MEQPTGSSSALTLQEAVNIFDMLADMEDIAFGYIEGGCDARAHIMCKRLIELGYDVGKAWAFETNDTILEFRTLDGERISWFFHVAPTIPVIVADNQVEQLVFDPSFFDGPVTIEEWGSVMNAGPKQLYLTKFGESPEGRTGDYHPHALTKERTDSEAQKLMDDYLQWQKNPRVVLSSALRKEIYEPAANESSFRGKTWISEALYEKNRGLNKKTETSSAPKNTPFRKQL